MLLELTWGQKKVFTSVEGQPVVSHPTFTEDFSSASELSF